MTEAKFKLVKLADDQHLFTITSKDNFATTLLLTDSEAKNLLEMDES